MKNKNKYLLAALLLLAAALFYFLRDWAKKNPHELIDTVMAEDEAIMASADLTAVTSSSDMKEAVVTSVDMSAVGASSDTKPTVLFEADPNRVKDDPNQNRILSGLRTIKTDPSVEFERLSVFIAKPLESMISEVQPDGTTVINIGTNLSEAVNMSQYYINSEKDVKFYLNFDFDSGEMTAKSCANIKNEVYQHGQPNSLEVRSDGDNYVVLMAADKWYLRLKYTTDMNFTGLLYKNISHGWQEVQEVELLGRRLEQSLKFDPRACRLGD